MKTPATKKRVLTLFFSWPGRGGCEVSSSLFIMALGQTQAGQFLSPSYKFPDGAEIVENSDGSVSYKNSSGTELGRFDSIFGTRTVYFQSTDFVVDGTAGAAAATLGTSAQSQVRVLNFDAAAADSDDHAYLSFVMPQDYRADSATIELIWTHTDADNSTETVTWIAAVNAVEPSAATLESFDAAGTAITSTLTQELTAASAGKVEKNILNIEVEDIAAGDLVTLKLTLDASATGLDTGEHVQLIGAELRYSVNNA